MLQLYDDDVLQELETAFAELEANAVAAVQAENIADNHIESPIRSLDLRYRGVDAVINVARPANGDYLRRYAELHEQLYGYVHDGRDVEIVAARVEVVGKTETPEEISAKPQAGEPKPVGITETCFGGEAHETGVFVREQLRAGDEIAGPAIVCETTSTVVINPGWQAAVLERGELLIGRQAASSSELASTVDDAAACDPVLLEIFNNLFASIAEQMGVTLQRTSCSTNVKERLDFSCAIFDPRGSLVVNAPHIPVHLGAMSETVKSILADNPDMGPGDVFVTNDPYRGGSHLPDVTVVTPVYSEASGRRQPAESNAQNDSQNSAGLRPPLTGSCCSSRQAGRIMRNWEELCRGVCPRFRGISPKKAC